ncbi:pyridoxamine 5'-phosphate oxidase family protein [Georgenia alba]|uniref:Pyridoxamine 5'-phosphate oxidase family protein n=1 Tax=Georgenia alba TaxID=2233858 RepID=A0ABW2Q7W8_9MICO
MPTAELLETTGEVAYETPTPWEEVDAALAGSRSTSWLVTERSDGRPHQRPVWAEWVDGWLYFCCGRTAKAGHLRRDPRCSIAVPTRDLDVVLEGRAHRVEDEAELHRVRDAYATKGWAPVVRDGTLHDVLGAPTAGLPPYDVYRVEPDAAYGFPTSDAGLSPTRWRF